MNLVHSLIVKTLAIGYLYLNPFPNSLYTFFLYDDYLTPYKALNQYKKPQWLQPS